MGTRLLGVVMLAMLGAMQYRLWAGEHSLATVWRLQQAVEAQTRENEGLRARNLWLDAEVRDLKEGLDAIEARARRELGMIGKNETFYQFVD